MKKVAIVCGSPSSEFLAPFDDPDWEIWVLGNRINRFDGKRVTRIFEIHDDLTEHGDPVRYAEFLAAKDIPMVVGEKFPYHAAHIHTFDFDACKLLYGSTYLTSSPAYMIAQAIMDGATHIGLYGVDLAVDSHEYFYQRACCEAWVGFARGRGIEVYIPPVSPVGKSDYVEGRGKGGKPDFSKPPFTQAEFNGMAEQHQRRIDEIDAEIRALELTRAAFSGARQAYERMGLVARAIESGNDLKTLSQSTVLKGA